MTKSDALPFLEDLVKALDNAFISTWQSTHAWQKQLDAAKEFLKELDLEAHRPQ